MRHDNIPEQNAPDKNAGLIPLIAGGISVAIFWWLPIVAGVLGISGFMVALSQHKTHPAAARISLLICSLGTLAAIIKDFNNI